MLMICCGLPPPVMPEPAYGQIQNGPDLLPFISAVAYALGYVFVYGAGYLAATLTVIDKLCPDFAADIRNVISREYHMRLLAVQKLYLRGPQDHLSGDEILSLREKMYYMTIRLDFKLELIIAMVTGRCWID